MRGPRVECVQVHSTAGREVLSAIAVAGQRVRSQADVGISGRRGGRGGDGFSVRIDWSGACGESLSFFPFFFVPENVDGVAIDFPTFW